MSGMPQQTRQLAFDWGEAGEAQPGSSEGREPQSASARTGTLAQDLMEAIVAAGNLRSALKRVRRNKGGPGGDGMTVEALPDYLKHEWPRMQVLAAGFRPNGLAWDTERKHLLVADVEDNHARLLDPDSGDLVASVHLPGRPHWCVYDAPRNRFLINVRAPACVVALDAGDLRLASTISISAPGPHGLDLDQERNRAFVACDEGEVVMLDLENDREIATIPIAGVPDATWFNATQHRLSVAIGDPGVIDVVNTDMMQVDEQVATEAGAHDRL